ncbi:MAG: PDZ domain-containing protein [Gammaproteobacteria bacterium]|nr:PDZ domain-containing protein [Gammaproteobacteria bacterium]
MRTHLIIISLALVTGVAIGIFSQNDTETSVVTIPAPNQNTSIVSTDQKAGNNLGTDRSGADIAELNRLLQNEIKARQNLGQRVETLVQQMNSFRNDLQSSERAISSEQGGDDRESDLPVSYRGGFNEQALIDRGMNSSQASELKIYFEQLEMDRLYLRDQSIRESWGREKLAEAMQALESREDDLKSQLGESTYDAYLYAAGRSNRVEVTSVLEKGQAGMAGIMSGDQITRYDNQRIYNGFDLREATASGNIGDSVEVKIVRDGRTMQFYLVRGPLGIRMNSVSAAP